MSMSANDVVLKTIIETGLEDVVANPYLIQDAMGVFVKNPLLAKKYGQKEIDNAKEWFKNNKIEVSFKYRNDKDNFPCITIEMGGAPLKAEMQTLGDERPPSEDEVLTPCEIGKPIPFMVNPVQITSYDPDTGFVGLPSSVRTPQLRAGMILVDPATGNAWPIIGTNGGVYIEPGSNLTASVLAVAPKNAFYKAKRKAVFFSETWNIGCHVHGDPAALLWLHMMTKYIILRYRAALERNGMPEIVISNSPLIPNQDWGSVGAEMVFSRSITLNCLAEDSWLDEPARILESVDMAVKNDDGSYTPGIRYLSNLDSPEALDTAKDPWATDEEG